MSETISEKLFKQTFEQKVPLSCTFEITKNCNLKCSHCYLGPEHSANARELSTDHIKSVLSEIRQRGTLFLTLTGGEIFLRNDIFEIMHAARRLSFALTIFSNGTLIDEITAKGISELSIERVELSLYGNNETHDAITESPGSFDRTVKAVAWLKRYGVKTAIKTPLMKRNINDLDWLISFAKENSVALKVDPTISPSNSGQTDILEQRLEDGQLETAYLTMNSYQPVQNPDNPPAPDTTYEDEYLCSAAHNLFAISSEGFVFPCLGLPVAVGNLRENCFIDIWHSEKMQGFRNVTRKLLETCSNCNSFSYCQRCPGIAHLEDKNILGPSRISCKIAEIKDKIAFSTKILDSIGK